MVNKDYSGKAPTIKRIRYKALDYPGTDEFDFTLSSDPVIINYFMKDSRYNVIKTDNLYYRYLIFNLDQSKQMITFDQLRILHQNLFQLDHCHIFVSFAAVLECQIVYVVSNGFSTMQVIQYQQGKGYFYILICIHRRSPLLFD